MFAVVPVLKEVKHGHHDPAVMEQTESKEPEKIARRTSQIEGRFSPLLTGRCSQGSDALCARASPCGLGEIMISRNGSLLRTVWSIWLLLLAGSAFSQSLPRWSGQAGYPPVVQSAGYSHRETIDAFQNTTPLIVPVSRVRWTDIRSQGISRRLI